jgi:hypothetical protein
MSRNVAATKVATIEINPFTSSLLLLLTISAIRWLYSQAAKVIEDSIYGESKLDVDSPLDKHWTGLDLLLFHPVLVPKLFSPNPGLDNNCPAQSKDN